jgi:hypothetical protein
MTPEKSRPRKARTDALRGKARRQAGKGYDRKRYDGTSSEES